MAMSLPLSLALVFCALWFAQNPFLQDACFKYSAQIICFLNWTAFLYKFAYARGRAAREAEHAAEMAAFKREREQYVLRLKETHVSEIDELDLCITLAAKLVSLSICGQRVWESTCAACGRGGRGRP